ncbi:MAG: peroxiredoxin-like family protein [Flavobacteriaceae bacterium]
MKKVALLTLTLFLGLIACKNDTKPVKAKTETKIVAKTDNAKFGIDASSNPQGLAVGSTAPNVTLNLADGTTQNLADLYKNQTVVLFFYRAYWCPVCNKHLSAFAKEAGKLKAEGVKLIAITPETNENIGKTREQTGIKFTIVSDADDSILKAFKVDFKVTDTYQQMIQDRLNASIAKTNANGEAVLPVPATFIIDKAGTIVYRQFDPNYKNRAGVDEILAHLPK